MHLFALIYLLLPCIGFSQIVTSSYDRTVLSTNPASATTRTLSQVAIFDTFKSSDSDITEIQPTTKAMWREEIKLNKVGLYFTGHGKFAPELYISKDIAEKSLDLDGDSTSPQESKINLTNNMINLGFRLKRNFSVGIKYYKPSFSYKENFDTTYENGETSSFDLKMEETLSGVGAGVTYQYIENWYVGAYYVSISHHTKFTETFSDTSGATNAQEGDETRKMKRYGLGLSFLEGTRGRGLRFEMALSRLIQEDDPDAEDGEEIFSALEFSNRKITFGFSLKLRKHFFYDNIELIEYVAGDKSFSDRYTPTYGGFLSFGSAHGHTVGLSGMIYKTDGTRQLFGREQDAETAVKQITFNYAYLF